ncbi:hypothetical protein MPER_02648, partial [Moniliophthora perniciosa FA553]
DDFFVIPGTKKVKYLKENVGAGSIKLSSDELTQIRKAAEAAEIAGNRYPPGWNEMAYADSPAL